MKKKYLLLFIIVLSGLGVVFYIGIVTPYNQKINNDKQIAEVYRTWEDEEYENVLQLCNSLLSEYPDNTDLLFMRGFAQFNLAYLTSKDSQAINNDLIWSSIFDIRQALSIDPHASLAEEGYYVLGKSYYLLSGVHLSQSIAYLQRVVDNGYVQDDVYEFLSSALVDAHRVDEAEAILIEGLKKNPTVSLYLAIINVCFALNKLQDISPYIQEAKLITNNEIENLALLIQEARLMMFQDNISEAIVAIKNIINKYPQSVEAHYYLGNAYELLGDVSKARYEWRQAYKMAPYWDKVVAKLDQDTIY